MRGVQVLEAAFNTNANELNEFIRTYKPAFPVGLIDPQFVVNYSQITPDMRPTTPVIFFIDRAGMIRSQYFGTDPFLNPETAIDQHVRAELDYLLNERTPAARGGATKKR
jgi:hypothetical protein